MTARTTLPADAGSAAAARRFVADVLLQRGFPDARIPDAVLLTSEVLTLAVAHGGSSLAVQVAAEHRMARVEIHLVDALAGMDGMARPEAPSGPRRLVLEALSEAWGIEVRSVAPCLWFEVRG